MTTLDIANMTIPERIQAMEWLWDSLSQQENEIESPRWHLDILDERMKRIQNGTALLSLSPLMN
jgi:uncharacterized coiled-coil protein SlyX